jgi:hypothetical protein
LYSGVDFSSEEFYVERVAGANIPFHPRSFATTGNSSWTFFTGPTFDGNTTCVPANNSNFFWGYEYEGIVQSVARGCGIEAARNVKQYLANN